MEKKILVIGGGGREHALVWKIAQSPLVSKIFCAPGNAGIAHSAECIAIKPTEIQPLADFSERNGIDLTVVGPEVPLVAGIVDEFQRRDLRIIGPKKGAAEIEGNKAFAKRFMERNRIPTAPFMTFSGSYGPEEPERYAKANLPCVIKANGLAAGKGAILCFSENDVSVAIERILVKKEFGDAGNWVVVEEFLEGEEATFKVFTDGLTAIPMPATQDHKPIFDGDKGPNTGGMGAYAPAPIISKELETEIMETIINPAIEGMLYGGRLYEGVLYAGLMITSDGPKVLEFNCRFGDPELQPIILLMESDIVPVLEAIADQRLSEVEIEWSKKTAVCVVMTSGGYPGEYETNKEIRGLDEVAKMEDVVVFHAGTRRDNGRIFTAGGRVLGVTALGNKIPEAVGLAYEAVSKISWEGEYHRTDIAQKALKRSF